jgi:asparagine synthase (glutamine-hydrolysing)
MRRLAIIDLATGDQPFISADRRVFLVFNGEIYNYVELREELRSRGHVFHTRSDTEVVLQAYLEWGEQAWPRLQGMFAIAIADLRGERPELLVVRDRVGIKPLYYLQQDEKLLFASELKALTVWSGFSRDVNVDAAVHYLAVRFVPGPQTLFTSVRKLPAGHLLRYRTGEVGIERWWTPPAGDPVGTMSSEEAAASFGESLRKSVRRHLLSDVPLGAFLSGGIDSNTIVALMAEFNPGKVKTFSISFPDFPQDDVDRAALTARTFQTDHEQIECRAADMAALPDIVWSLDEPIGDAIVVPMYVLSRHAARKVKVVLSGDGADEILGGYIFQRRLVQLDMARRWLPGFAWQIGRMALAALPLPLLDRLFDYPGKLGTDGKRKLDGMLSAFAADSLSGLHRRGISLLDPDDLADAVAPRTCSVTKLQKLTDYERLSSGDALQRLIRMAYEHWLPDLMLTKYDKLTMAHSLEGRVPYLDETVIDAAARIPSRHKLTAKANKKPLRDFAQTILPPEIVSAPKAAFYIPMESYIRSPQMSDLMRAMLDPARLARRGLVRPEWIKGLQEAPAAKGFLPLKRLFSVMMLELWFEKFCPDWKYS